MLLASANSLLASATTGGKSENVQTSLRVVTLSPHLAEMVERVGGVSSLVGVSAHSDYSKNTQSKTVVSDARNIDFERLRQLNPHIVLVWSGGTPAQLISKIRTTLPQARIFEFAPKKLDDIEKDLIKIGEVLNLQQSGLTAARSYTQELQDILGTSSKHSKTTVKVFYQVWPQPLMTINHEQMIHDVIERCGGTNIFSKEKLLVPQVTREAVLAANPDLMIGTQQAGKDMDWSMWRSFENLSANRYQAFLSIPGPSISQPTPSILQGTRQICEAIARVRELKSQAPKAGTR